MYMVDKVVKLKHQKAHDSRLYSIQLVSERQREIDEHQLGIRCFIVVIIKALYELVMFAKKRFSAASYIKFPLDYRESENTTKKGSNFY